MLVQINSFEGKKKLVQWRSELIDHFHELYQSGDRELKWSSEYGILTGVSDLYLDFCKLHDQVLELSQNPNLDTDMLHLLPFLYTQPGNQSIKYLNTLQSVPLAQELYSHIKALQASITSCHRELLKNYQKTPNLPLESKITQFLSINKDRIEFEKKYKWIEGVIEALKGILEWKMIELKSIGLGTSDSQEQALMNDSLISWYDFFNRALMQKALYNKARNIKVPGISSNHFQWALSNLFSTDVRKQKRALMLLSRYIQKIKNKLDDLDQEIIVLEEVITSIGWIYAVINRLKVQLDVIEKQGIRYTKEKIRLERSKSSFEGQIFELSVTNQWNIKDIRSELQQKIDLCSQNIQHLEKDISFQIDKRKLYMSGISQLSLSKQRLTDLKSWLQLKQKEEHMEKWEVYSCDYQEICLQLDRIALDLGDNKIQLSQIQKLIQSTDRKIKNLRQEKGKQRKNLKDLKQQLDLPSTNTPDVIEGMIQGYQKKITLIDEELEVLNGKIDENDQSKWVINLKIKQSQEDITSKLRNHKWGSFNRCSSQLKQLRKSRGNYFKFLQILQNYFDWGWGLLSDINSIDFSKAIVQIDNRSIYTKNFLIGILSGIIFPGQPIYSLNLSIDDFKNRIDKYGLSRYFENGDLLDLAHDLQNITQLKEKWLWKLKKSIINVLDRFEEWWLESNLQNERQQLQQKSSAVWEWDLSTLLNTFEEILWWFLDSNIINTHRFLSIIQYLPKIVNSAWDLENFESVIRDFLTSWSGAFLNKEGDLSITAEYDDLWELVSQYNYGVEQLWFLKKRFINCYV